MGSNSNPQCTTVRLNNDCVNNSSATLHLNCPLAFPGTRSGFTSTLKWINRVKLNNRETGTTIATISNYLCQRSWSVKLICPACQSRRSMKLVTQFGQSGLSAKLVCQVGGHKVADSRCSFETSLSTAQSRAKSTPSPFGLSFLLRCHVTQLRFRRFQNLKNDSCEDS